MAAKKVRGKVTSRPLTLHLAKVAIVVHFGNAISAWWDGISMGLSSANLSAVGLRWASGGCLVGSLG